MGELYNPFPKLPKNIRQIGDTDQVVRLYVEDYVNTYLKRLYPAGNQTLRVGLLLFLGVLLVAILAGVLSPYDPYYLGDDLLMPPGSENHPLGTDHMGHDVLSMILHGSRTSLTIGIVSALISGLIGTMLGAFAGYFGGALDKITSEVINIFLMIPTFFLVLIIVSIFGSNMFNVMLVIGLTSWPSNARMMRVQAMSLKERTYIKGAVVMGESRCGFCSSTSSPTACSRSSPTPPWAWPRRS